MSTLAFTLCEDGYHLGAGALLNSLVGNGFQGQFVLGYRGSVPCWAESVARELNPFGVTFEILEIDGATHLAQLKPTIAIKLLESSLGVRRFHYFDPDILIKRQWQFFEDWVDSGIAVVEEIVKQGMSENHPQRAGWVRFAGSRGREIQRGSDRYMNSGYFGFTRENASFLREWEWVMEQIRKKGHDVDFSGGYQSKFKAHELSAFFSTWDQDALNLALMLVGDEVSSMGPEAMDFRPAGRTMSHAVGSHKPWHGGYLKNALRGQMPRSVDKLFWSSVTEPIRLFSTTKVKQNSYAIRLASLIGRFYRR